MVYLDYSATTPINKDVLDTYVKVSNEYIGNANSIHELGVKSSKIIDAATKQIKDILNLNNHDIIYTSGASESNNTVIKCVSNKYKNRGMRIITTPLEHSSVIAPLNYLVNDGFTVDMVDIKDDGEIDYSSLESLMGDDVILVSIGLVNSETGVMQDIDKINKIVKKYPKCFLHVDATQAIGKVKVNLSDIDFISCSAHKFYGPQGIGLLIKKDNINIDSLISGGKSTTKFRSGTPPVALIVSLSKALRIAYDNIEEKYNRVKKLNDKLKSELEKNKLIKINSTELSIPHILNFSVDNIKPETLLHALANHEIYISTKSACSASNSISKSVYAITKDEKRALSSLRVSISYLTTEEEINCFLDKLTLECNKLNFKEV